MEDSELQAIRAARMAQLQQQAGGGGGGSGGGGGGDEEQAKRQAAQHEQMKRDILATVLDSAARERLARIALVSPQRSSQIEAILVRMAQTGQLRGRVSEEGLIGLLEQVCRCLSFSDPGSGWRLNAV
ncbi:DNA-binding TFAR19-related protein [Auricularia subglabra TFB-10046 SS5]|nr:DNA-binding TFAR19-related protein [Auricularia subglabra TFB-10046 SS5]